MLESYSLEHLTSKWSDSFIASIYRYLLVMSDAPDVSDGNNSAEQAVRNQIENMSTIGWRFKDCKVRLCLIKVLV